MKSDILDNTLIGEKCSIDQVNSDLHLNIIKMENYLLVDNC